MKISKARKLSLLEAIQLKQSLKKVRKKVGTRIIKQLPDFKVKEIDDEKLDTFDFDIFTADRLEKHRLIWTMWQKLDLFEKYNIK